MHAGAERAEVTVEQVAASSSSSAFPTSARSFADSYHQHCECYRIVIEPMPPLYIRDTLPCSSVPKSDLNRAVFLFLRFELLDERSEARGHGRRDSVVLILEALPNCRQRNASIATGFNLH
jgi:hypothetical protein